MASNTDFDTDEFLLPPYARETLLRQTASAQVQVELGGMSHQGLVRDRNEDCFLIVRADRLLRPLATNLPEASIPAQFDEMGFGLLVADGMGGMAAGDVASRMAVQTLITLVLNTPDWIMRTGQNENERILARIGERYRKADEAIREEAAVDPKLGGMGSTLTVAYSLGVDLFLGHIGDSRAYLLRGAEFRRLTSDHTLAQGLADQGAISANELVSSRLRHVLTRHLGGKRPAKADVRHLQLQHGDQVLLCSDGLTEMVNDADIAGMLRKASNAEAACQDLIDAALKGGGTDNVTAVLARYRLPSRA